MILQRLLLIVLSLALTTCTVNRLSRKYDDGAYVNKGRKVLWLKRMGSTSGQAGLVTVEVDADPATFKPIGDSWFATDKNKVFCAGNTLKGADPESFEVLKGLKGRDKNHGYGCYDVVEGSHGPSYNAVPLSNDNPEVEWLQGGYAADKYYVYNYGTKTMMSPEGLYIFGRFYMRDHEKVVFHYQDEYEIDVCDLDSFKGYNKPYANDDKCLYFWGKKIANVNGKSLKIYGTFAYDGQQVFASGRPMSGVDPKSFETFPGGAKDKNGCFNGSGKPWRCPASKTE